jgi:hypothetical protein
MPSRDPPDPIRATLVAILQQLNRAESINEGQKREQVLELLDLERLLGKFWAVDQGHVKISLALGLLVRNGLVEARAAPNYAPAAGGPQHRPRAQYQITAAGKQFLVEAQEKSDRIS